MLQLNDIVVSKAIEIAEMAAISAKGYFRGSLGIEYKSDESPVTQADRGIEAEVRAYLKEHFPADGILGEEHGIEGRDAQNMWIIDPIDGTKSFLSGHPLFGFLLGHVSHGVADVGVISMPMLGECIVGQKHGGATMNGTPIRTSAQYILDQAILYINEGDKIHRNHPDVFGRLMSVAQMRRLAYDCYPHALMAMGHVDAVVDYDLQPYDYLPVSVVVEAAGGVMTDWQGNSLNLQSGASATVSAATPELHSQIIALVADST